MGLGLLSRYYKKNDKEYYADIPFGLLMLNYVVQRIFKINNDVPFSVHYTSKIQGVKYSIIAPDVRRSLTVSGGIYISVHEKSRLEIGEGTIFAWNICIQTANHNPSDFNEYIYKPVIIGKKCWIGNSVSILPGVTLGDNVIIGANSVVTKSFPSNVVIAGVPAKIIKQL